MSQGYANARDALPPELLAEVQEHWSGMLWVPAPKTAKEERRKFVLALKEQGTPSKEIAVFAGITTRRVNQILQDHRNKIRQFSDSSGM